MPAGRRRSTKESRVDRPGSRARPPSRLALSPECDRRSGAGAGHSSGDQGLARLALDGLTGGSWHLGNPVVDQSVSSALQPAVNAARSTPARTSPFVRTARHRAASASATKGSLPPRRSAATRRLRVRTAAGATSCRRSAGARVGRSCRTAPREARLSQKRSRRKGAEAPRGARSSSAAGVDGDGGRVGIAL
jgi:hypothetical protein